MNPVNNYVRTLFTEKEDQNLIALVKKYGKGKWKIISQRMGSRTTRQCRERYQNYLDPALDASAWTCDEEKQLLLFVEQYGRKWALISKYFPNRSASNIKNQYRKIIAHKQPRQHPEVPMQEEKLDSIDAVITAYSLDKVNPIY